MARAPRDVIIIGRGSDGVSGPQVGGVTFRASGVMAHMSSIPVAVQRLGRASGKRLMAQRA